jgi:hypothetical protein
MDKIGNGGVGHRANSRGTAAALAIRRPGREWRREWPARVPGVAVNTRPRNRFPAADLIQSGEARTAVSYGTSEEDGPLGTTRLSYALATSATAGDSHPIGAGLILAFARRLDPTLRHAELARWRAKVHRVTSPRQSAILIT